MGWLKVLLDRKQIVGFSLLGMIVLSLVFIESMDSEFYPEVSEFAITISAESPNVPALEVEENVTKPIENAISDVEGVESFSSSSVDGLSTITVNVMDDKAYEGVRTVVSDAYNEITDVDEIDVSRSTSGYEFYMDLYGGDLSEMSTFADHILKPRLENLSAVNEVRVVGQSELGVLVELDTEKLNDADLAFDDIEAVLTQQNENISVGRTSSDTSDKPLLTWNTQLSSIDDVRNILIPTENGAVLLDNIADISVQESRNQQDMWRNGDNNYVMVSVSRTTDATQVEMTEAVRGELEALDKEGHTEGFVLDQTIVHSDFVGESIGGLQTNVMIGGILLIIVLFVTLKNVVAAVIMGISIPVTVLVTFFLMSLFDISINLISILGLGIALGMIVDSSIVIMESIYKKKEQGLSDRSSAVEGTKEVLTPVFALSLTTMTVFLPIGLISGQIGDFAKVVAIVIVFSQLTALIVCFTLIPVMAEKWLKVKQRKEKSTKPNALYEKLNNYVDWMGKKAIRKIGVIGLFFAIFVSSLFLTFGIPVTILPDFYNRQAEIYIGLEDQTTSADREGISQGISEFLNEIEDIEGYSVRALDPNRMYLYVEMTPEEDAIIAQGDINSLINNQLETMSEEYPITASGSVTYPIQISITGEELDTLRGISEDLSEGLSNIEGIQGISSSFENSREEQRIVLDRNRLVSDGVTPVDIKKELELISSKLEVGIVTTENSHLPLLLAYGDDVQGASPLSQNTIDTINGERPLSDYVNLEDALTPHKIEHENGERVIQLVGDVDGRGLGDVGIEINALIENYDIESGYNVEVGGEIEQQDTASKEMLLVILFAIILVYAILSVQFNSLIQPLIIMSIMPLTLTGVLIGLFTTQTDLNLLSVMGMLVLMGIVTNNGILLIDSINKLRLSGEKRFDAIKKACKDRIRPIFISLITTVSAAIPLAITTGHASKYQQPMAIALIFGFLFSFFITFLFLPVVYLLFEDTAYKVKTIFKKKRMTEDTPRTKQPF